jgi:hypothetical protein
MDRPQPACNPNCDECQKVEDRRPGSISGLEKDRPFDPLASQQVMLDVQKELIRARSKHPRPQASAHEGISILREEFEEAEKEVFHGKDRSLLRAELIQVAAMAQRMIEDLRL